MASMPEITVVMHDVKFRDYVAAQIMAAFMTHHSSLDASEDDLNHEFAYQAKIAYKCADALAAAKEVD